MTYHEQFQPGTRVVVRCCSDEWSTDNQLEGCRGVVVSVGMWALVKFDKKPKHWANPACVGFHNLAPELIGTSIMEGRE